MCVLGSIAYRAGVVNPHGSCTPCTFGRLWLVASPALVKMSLCCHNMARAHRPLAVAEILVLRHLAQTEPNVLGKPQVRHWRRLPALLPVQLADGQRTHTFGGRPHPDVKLPACPRAPSFVFNLISPFSFSSAASQHQVLHSVFLHPFSCSVSTYLRSTVPLLPACLWCCNARFTAEEEPQCS